VRLLNNENISVSKFINNEINIVERYVLPIYMIRFEKPPHDPVNMLWRPGADSVPKRRWQCRIGADSVLEP
jgi:hypothetical protein